ncbi:uncharacterized protein YfaT (DUF1175 family) [Pseudorhizobium tarimense]|uniref:Uncharacterized protein YfaT (DUF1175 family) n=1 Tax=Pseudorhizobium tarimense TaxID=1079109 RepID=A0ABV2HE62_9HYPH|nr:hypothetical protein [Pseudorhizobium tarimense]MCJ8521524.1 hypothetical protein [Pseudorhizobium tarimense]
MALKGRREVEGSSGQYRQQFVTIVEQNIRETNSEQWPRGKRRLSKAAPSLVQ